MQTLPKVKQRLLLFAKSGAAQAICNTAHQRGRDAGGAQLLTLPQQLVTRPEAADILLKDLLHAATLGRHLYLGNRGVPQLLFPET